MNLHSNQIQFSATRPTHVQFAHEENTIAQAVQGLTSAAMQFVEHKAKVDDVELQQTLDAISAEGLSEISRANPEDNDYSDVKQKYFDRLNEALSNAPSDAQTRFARNNPMYLEKQSVVVNNAIFEKQQALDKVRISNLVPQLASNVTTGASDYNTELTKLQEMLRGVDNVYAEEQLHSFNKQISVANINNLIMAGRYSDAQEIINDPVKSPELTPDERITSLAKIQTLITEEQKRREKAAEELKSDVDDQFKKDLIQEGLATLNKQDDSYVRFIRALVDNEPVPRADGTFMDAKDIDPMVRLEVAKTFEASKDYFSAQRQNQINAMNSAANLETMFKEAIEGKGREDIIVAAQKISDYLISPESDYLPKSGDYSRYKLAGMVNDYRSAQAEAMGTRIDVDKDTVLYNRFNRNPRAESVWRSLKLPEADLSIVQSNFNSLYKQKFGTTDPSKIPYSELDKISKQALYGVTEKEIPAGLLKTLGSGLAMGYQATLGWMEKQESINPLGALAQTAAQQDTIFIDGLPVTIQYQGWGGDGSNIATQWLNDLETAMATAKHRYYNEVLKESQPRTGSLGDYMYSLHFLLLADSLSNKATAQRRLDDVGLAGVTQEKLISAANKTHVFLKNEGLYNKTFGADEYNTKEADQLRNNVFDLYFYNIINGKQALTKEQQEARAQLTSRAKSGTQTSWYNPAINIPDEEKLYGEAFFNNLKEKYGKK